MSAKDFQPEVFGKYILLEKIAAGGMAEIYLAKLPGAENVSKFLAIKRILPQYSNNHEFIEMFKEEAKIAINLSHANVVQITEFGVQNSLFYLAMQYVDGKNLRQVLNRLKKENSTLTIPQIVFMIKEAAQGLYHAHSCVDDTTGSPLNITHRDISPQNIMVSYDGEVRIIDFGIAKAESKIEATRAGTLKGKFGYMSPEQADGYEVDLRTDIFSLGIVLWELLARDRLFVANSDINTLKKIRECHIPSLKKLDPTIPSELERITMRALARDRTLRYQSAEEMAQDLNFFLNKQYPEFTSKELSSLLKDSFLEEREYSRQKFIEYSKIQLHQDDQTLITDVTKTITQTNSNFIGKNEGTSATGLSHLKISKDPAIENFDLQFDRADLLKNPTARRKPRPAPSQPSNSSVTVTRSPYGTVTGYPTYTSTVTVRRKTIPWGTLFLLLIIGFGGYQAYNDPNLIMSYVQNLVGTETSQSSEVESQEPKEEVPLQPQEAFFNILVTSVPSGATIYVDGQKSDVITPGQIRVPANKAYSLRLEKDGFLNETKRMLTIKQADEVQIQLKRRQVGYVNVQVSGGNAAIYINGKKIAEKAPVVKFPVIANTNLRIQAFNPADNIFVEKSIQVEPKKTATVHLNLKSKSSRVPSGRK